MTRGDDQCLDDIRDMCESTADIVARGCDALDAYEVLWLALERAVEIAGEAATQLTESARSQYRDVA